MSTAAEFEASDFGHYQCEALLKQLDKCVLNGNWPLAVTSHERLEALALAHFGAEEETLFPAFEQTELGALGSTILMREEHQRMARILGLMGGAIAANDSPAYVDLSLSLRQVLAKHARKEDFLIEVLLGTRSVTGVPVRA